MNEQINLHSKHKTILFVLLFIGIMLRVYHFGVTPSGLNQDEAFAGYEAFSLLHYGIDSAGYHNPTYFVSWGSGMNVLESYLAIPFISLLGNTVLAVRMPMLICSILSLPVFYLLLKELYGSSTALFGLSVLVICPWHVMLSRWGLESNLAPAFLLFGLYFLIKGLNDNRYWPLAACMYGLSLYAYAITWMVVPLTLLLVFSYMLICRNEFSWKYLLLSVLILFILALPHMLFMLINMNVMPEIRTPFFSIPKLVAMRQSEISLSNIVSRSNITRVFQLVLGYGDDMPWNTFSGFGMYYMVSIPLILIGMCRMAILGYQQIKERKMDAESVIWIGAVCSISIITLVAPINVNKANHLHFYIIILITAGMKTVLNMLPAKKRIITVVVALVYGLSVWNFSCKYFKKYDDIISVHFRNGVEECIEFAQENGFKDINVDGSVYYPQILFFDETPTPEFIESRVYTNYPDCFLDVKSFTKYTFGIQYEAIDYHDAYIVPSWKLSKFPVENFSKETFGIYTILF